MSLSLIWFIVFLISLNLMFIFFIASDGGYNEVCAVFSFIFLLVALFALITFPLILIKVCTTPEQEYQNKVSTIEKAEKELQKFLIDHPEFKETEKK